MTCFVYIVCPSVLSYSNLKLHQTLEAKNIFKQENKMLQLTFNPGLTLTGFRTTRPRKSRHKPNPESTSKYGFSPDLGRKNGDVPSMRMQVILDSSFACPGSAPIWGGKKGEFRDWTTARAVRGVSIFFGLQVLFHCWPGVKNVSAAPIKISGS